MKNLFLLLLCLIAQISHAQLGSWTKTSSTTLVHDENSYQIIGDFKDQTDRVIYINPEASNVVNVVNLDPVSPLLVIHRDDLLSNQVTLNGRHQPFLRANHTLEDWQRADESIDGRLMRPASAANPIQFFIYSYAHDVFIEARMTAWIRGRDGNGQQVDPKPNSFSYTRAVIPSNFPPSRLSSVAYPSCVEVLSDFKRNNVFPWALGPGNTVHVQGVEYFFLHLASNVDTSSFRLLPTDPRNAAFDSQRYIVNHPNLNLPNARCL